MIMECFSILNIQAFDCFCTIPIIFTIVVGGLLAMANFLRG